MTGYGSRQKSFERSRRCGRTRWRKVEKSEKDYFCVLSGKNLRACCVGGTLRTPEEGHSLVRTVKKLNSRVDVQFTLLKFRW